MVLIGSPGQMLLTVKAPESSWQESGQIEGVVSARGAVGLGPQGHLMTGLMDLASFTECSTGFLERKVGIDT